MISNDNALVYSTDPDLNRKCINKSNTKPVFNNTARHIPKPERYGRAGISSASGNPQGSPYAAEKTLSLPPKKRIIGAFCVDNSPVETNDRIIRVSRETKGRKGKGVSVITGLNLNETSLNELAQKLKRKFGAGGTITNGTIEIQGEHRDALVVELEKLGFSVKRSGG